MEEILSIFQEIEKRWQQASYMERFEIVEEARHLYKSIRPCEQRIVVLVFPKWEVTLRPNLL